MKKLIPLLALYFLASQAQAQNFSIDSLKTKYWELGLVASDILAGALSVDFSMAIAKNQVIGLRSTITNDYYVYNYSRFYDGANYLYRGGVFHKIYLPQERNRNITIRHGLCFSLSEYYSQREEWIEFNNLGNTQYRLGLVDFEDRHVSVGYELLIGLQQSYRSKFFLEYYVGARYLELVNTNSEYYNLSELKADANYYSDGNPFDIYSNNVRIVVGFVVGLQRQP